MKRLALLSVFILLALQFTCGNTSSIENQQKPSAVLCKDYDKECKQAESALNKSNAEFWMVSHRIDSVLSNRRETKRVTLMRSSDPVQY